MKVHEIFRSIQGEGKLAGVPMTFIRLYGCNLACPGCDTYQAPDDYWEASPEEIALDPRIEDTWVCLTGGEPLQWKDDLRYLAFYLHDRGHKTALETNGTKVFPAIIDWVCVSPKTKAVNCGILAGADEIKVLVGSGMYYAEDYLRSYEEFKSKISLLPWWDENYEDNLKRAIGLCQKYQVRLAVQMHKYIGVK